VAQAKKAATKRKGQAAVARQEKEPKPKQVTFKGLTLTLPLSLPETFVLDIVELEATEGPMPLFRMLRSILGAEQFGQLRSAIDRKVIMTEDLDSIITDVFEKYGIGPGESSASQDS
jgi:hypothetical protein